MKEILVELTGQTPLLMNNIMGANLGDSTRKTTKKYDSKEDAERSAYWMEEKGKKMLCVPARCITACIRGSASYFKTKGRNLKPIIAGAVRVEPENVSLGTDKYEIDIQSVVIQRARVLRSRARLSQWKLKFKLIYNEDYISDAEVLHKILEEGGVKVGLLDFRPAKSGSFGTFAVTKFEEQK